MSICTPRRIPAIGKEEHLESLLSVYPKLIRFFQEAADADEMVVCYVA